jgi:hypothetical protein
MKTVIEMALEAGFYMPQGESFYEAWPDGIDRFAELVRADEQKKWQDQTAVETHEAILDEREACAKLCEEMPWVTGQSIPSNFEMAAAIRARSNT